MAAHLVDDIGVLAGLFGIAGFAPQIVRILRERDAHAISLKMYAATTLGFGLWVTYGLAQHNWPIVGANTLMLAMAATILALKLRFK